MIPDLYADRIEGARLEPRPLIETSIARITPFDSEVASYVRNVTRDMTRACVSLVLSTGFAALVRPRRG